MSFNRRQFLQSSAVATASLASAFVCKAYAEPLAEIELILAFDASGSMFGLNNEGIRNWDTQISGYVHALGQQEIIEKLVGGRVYLRTILWSDGKIHPLVLMA